MRLPENLFSKMTLAALPFTVYAFDLEKTCLVTLLTAGVTWLTLFFFWFTRRLFPKIFLKEAFFLWLLVWAQSFWTLWGLGPLWIMSVFFLAPRSFLEKETNASNISVFSKELPHYLWERIVGGFAFIGFVLFVTWARNVLERNGAGIVFQQPAAVFLFIAALAVFWKCQPFRK